MFSEFLDRNAIVVGILLLVAGGGVVLGLAGGARQQRSFALGASALLCALVCVLVGVAQRQAFLKASVFVATMPGLLLVDQERIVAEKLADAGYALGVALALALLPLVAGGSAVRRVLRARRS
jgi:hypothetical protein